jgi:hypothetical protein
MASEHPRASDRHRVVSRRVGALIITSSPGDGRVTVEHIHRGSVRLDPIDVAELLDGPLRDALDHVNAEGPYARG